MNRHQHVALRYAIVMVWLLTAAGTCFAQEAERTISRDTVSKDTVSKDTASNGTVAEQNTVSESCLVDPQACLAEKRQEFKNRGTLGLGLHPKADGDTTTWTVHRLVAGGAAEKGGLERGDILLGWNREPPSTPENPDKLEALVEALKVGEDVEMQVLRGLETLTFTLTPQAADEDTMEYWLQYFAKEHFDKPTAGQYEREAERRLQELEAGDH